MFGLRKFLQGSSIMSGILLGVSAASNLVTAVPAFGMALTASNMRKGEHFILSFLGKFVIVNLPFIVPNRSLWLQFWTYHENWFAEGTWMLGFFTNTFPLRQFIFVALFASLSAIILYVWFRERRRWENIATTVTDSERAKLTIRMTWLLVFAFFFSSYVFIPQMNLILLPFFVLAAITMNYFEFLTFDIANALVIVWGVFPAFANFWNNPKSSGLWSPITYPSSCNHNVGMGGKVLDI
jgi:hypothetical protein